MVAAAADEHLNWVVTALTRYKVRHRSVSVSESRVIAAMILSLFAQPRVLTTDMTDQWLIKASSKSRNNFQYSELSRHQHQPVVSAL